MEWKAGLELLIVTIILATVVYLSSKVYCTETDPSVRLLALGIILPAILGWYNMFKLFWKDKRIEVEEKKLEEMKKQGAQKDTEIEALKEANRLKDRQNELLTQHKY